MEMYCSCALSYSCSLNIYSFIGRRHRHIAENSDKKRNVGKHIQPVEIANNDAQEDDQDEVVDGPKPLPQAFPIGPYIVRAQGNNKSCLRYFPNGMTESLIWRLHV